MRDVMVKKVDSDLATIPGGGKGPTRLTAILGALGEIAERLLASLHYSGVFDRLGVCHL